MVALSQRAGLEVQVGPWGLGRVFGGEAESHFVAAHPELGQVLDDGQRVAAGCLNQEGFRAFVRSWATAAVETGAERIFWDEPHWAHPSHFDAAPERWGCRCEVCRSRYRESVGGDMPAELTPEVVAFREACLVEFIGDVVAHVAARGGRSTVCVLPFTLSDWAAVARLPGLDTLATDPYWEAFGQPVVPFVDEYAGRVARLAAEHGVGAQLWIQGFRLGPEDEGGHPGRGDGGPGRRHRGPVGLGLRGLRTHELSGDPGAGAGVGHPHRRPHRPSPRRIPGTDFSAVREHRSPEISGTW